MLENLKIFEITKNIFFNSVKKYKYLFDQKIKNSTIIVALISIIIFGVIFTINNKNNFNSSKILQANILQSKKINVIKNDNFIKINGKIYKLVLVEK